MSKFDTSLKGPDASKIHSSQYKASNFSNAGAGRVMPEGKKSIPSMSRPAGRTGYVAGCKTASTDAK